MKGWVFASIFKNLTDEEQDYEILTGSNELAEFVKPDNSTTISIVSKDGEKYLYTSEIKEGLPCINGFMIEKVYRLNFNLENNKMVLLSLTKAGAKLFPDGVTSQMRFFWIEKITKCPINPARPIIEGWWFDNICNDPTILQGKPNSEIGWPTDIHINEYQEITKGERTHLVKELYKVGGVKPDCQEILIQLIKKIRKEKI